MKEIVHFRLKYRRTKDLTYRYLEAWSWATQRLGEPNWRWIEAKLRVGMKRIEETKRREEECWQAGGQASSTTHRRPPVPTESSSKKYNLVERAAARRHRRPPVTRSSKSEIQVFLFYLSFLFIFQTFILLGRIFGPEVIRFLFI